MLPRWVIVFGGILALGGMLTWALPVERLGAAYWTGLLVAAVLAGLLTRARERARPAAGWNGEDGEGDGASGGTANPYLRRGEFLCDSCKYNHPDLCGRPERPNATRCPDYKQRG